MADVIWSEEEKSAALEQLEKDERSISWEDKGIELQCEVTALREALETIAGFAPGNGDVCEIIAKRARAALQKVGE